MTNDGRLVMNKWNQICGSAPGSELSTKTTHLHDIDKHLTGVSHRYLKRLSTTGYVFRLCCHLCAAALIRTVRRSIPIAGRHRNDRPRPEGSQVAVRGAAVSGGGVFQLIGTVGRTAFKGKYIWLNFNTWRNHVLSETIFESHNNRRTENKILEKTQLYISN